MGHNCTPRLPVQLQQQKSDFSSCCPPLVGRWIAPQRPELNSCASLGFAIRSELFEVGPQTGDILLLLDGYDHSRAGNFRGWIWHELLERSFAPYDACVLNGV